MCRDVLAFCLYVTDTAKKCKWFHLFDTQLPICGIPSGMMWSLLIKIRLKRGKYITVIAFRILSFSFLRYLNVNLPYHNRILILPAENVHKIKHTNERQLVGIDTGSCVSELIRTSTLESRAFFPD